MWVTLTGNIWVDGSSLKDLGLTQKAQGHDFSPFPALKSKSTSCSAYSFPETGTSPGMSFNFLRLLGILPVSILPMFPKMYHCAGYVRDRSRGTDQWASQELLNSKMSLLNMPQGLCTYHSLCLKCPIPSQAGWLIQVLTYFHLHGEAFTASSP